MFEIEGVIMAVYEETTKSFKIIMIDNYGSKMFLNLNNPASNIQMSYIKGEFLAKAAPVLGVTAIDDAYYVTMTKGTLNSNVS